MRFKNIVLAAAAGLLLSSCSLFKEGNRGKSATSKSQLNSDSAKGQNDSLTVKRPKPYKEIITKSAISDSGLFTVHRIDSRYFFEIPKSLLDLDILVVSRIAKGASNFPKTWFGYAGDEINQNVIGFTKAPNGKLFIRRISYFDRSADSSVNGLYRSVVNSNVQPILASFEIKTYGSDSSMVIDVTDWLSSDNNLLFFNPVYKGAFNIGGFQKDKSFTNKIQSFPLNVELESVYTFMQNQEPVTFDLNTSIVLLPKNIMKPRYYDERVGFFGEMYIDFDNPQGVKESVMITRWRLEPKPEDSAKYLRGELVVPAKPIIYYIDPATPKKWIPYLIQGVNDWQKAFEKAGFKNAIYALEAPKDDPEWNLLDARHNAIVYKSSAFPNASGPHVHDPRTGEILETHINWYHNVIQLLHDWYMIQAGPNDPHATKMVFDDDLMGRLIRFVASHEVGHTLGLQHNFGASSTVPVDSLRSKSYISKNGFCPSIMDYARFNYVAQPEDGFEPTDLLPCIGVYDKWAIDWGYRWLPQLKTKEEEKAYMDEWITKSLEKDKHLFFSPQQEFGAVNDPRAQSEDIGDDAMKAGKYGIENLKKVMSNLIAWTKEPNSNYSSLIRMNNEVVNQYSRYIVHVINNVARNTWTWTTSSQKDSALGFVSRQKQKEAIKFLQDQVFTTPHWLFPDNITYLIGGFASGLPGQIQNSTLDFLLNGYGVAYFRYARMAMISQIAPLDKIYTFDELLTDLEEGILKEIKSRSAIDYYRRRLQKIYAQKLVEMNNFRLSNHPYAPLAARSDFFTIVQDHMKQVIKSINRAMPQVRDKETKDHLLFIKNHLLQSIDPNASLLNVNVNSVEKSSKTTISEPVLPELNPNKAGERSFKKVIPVACWQNENPFGFMP